MSRWGKLLRRANTAQAGDQPAGVVEAVPPPRDAAGWPRLVAVLVLAYALSPIDLIPDFIPVLGLLDDVILLPLGIALAVKLTPRHLWLARVAEAETGGRPAAASAVGCGHRADRVAVDRAVVGVVAGVVGRLEPRGVSAAR